MSQKTWPKYASPVRPRAPTETRSSSGLAALVRWYTAKRNARCTSSSPSTTTSLASQRSCQAASCAERTARQPSARLRARASLEAGAGSSSGVSPRATATMRSSSTVCPATDCHCQTHRSGNGRAGTSGLPPARSVAVPAIATALSVPSVRHVPMSGSNRVGSIPSPAIAKLASSLTSTPSRSSEKRRSCNPTARSAIDTRRSSRPARVMPARVRWASSDRSTPRRRSSLRAPARISPSLSSCGLPSSRMRTRGQSATGTSAGTGGSVFGRSNRPAT